MTRSLLEADTFALWASGMASARILFRYPAALIGQIFFTLLEGARDWGATSLHEAFTVSAAAATWYQVASFGAVFLLVFLIRGRSASGEGGVRAAAQPIPVEA